MPPNPDNPRGYFEHNDVVNLHDRLLLALDRSWDDVSPLPPDWWQDQRLAPYRTQLLSLLQRDFPGAPLWGLKDPRLCRLLPWWESVWADFACRPLFVLVRRAPPEVAASLERREGMSAVKACLLWLRHLLEAERGSRPHARIIVDFNDFVADEDAALAPVRHALGLHGPETGRGTRVVDPALGRVATPADWPEIPGMVSEADAALRVGMAGREQEMRLALDRLTDNLRACEPFLAPDDAARNRDLSRQLDTSRQQARWYEEEWRKAQEQTEKLRVRLAKREVKEAPASPVSNLDNHSILRNNELSILRKTGERSSSKLTQFFRFFRGPR